MPQAQTIALPKRIPLAVQAANRDDDTLKDAKLVNCYLEKTDEGEFQIYKRAGLLTASTLSGNGMGVFNWKGDIFAAFGSTLYKNGLSVGTINNAGGVYAFGQSKGDVPKLQLGNGIFAYNYDSSNGLVLIDDSDFPAAFVKGWAFLDETTYVMTPAAEIFGSDLGDTTSWDPVNKIIAQIEPDGGKALAKQLVYAVAIKEWNTEFFYDADNPDGSPLGTVQGLKQDYGTVSADSVQDIDSILLWIATNRSSSPQVIKIERGQLEIVSNKAIDRLLDKADFSTVFSWQLKDEGHKFYVITMKNSNLTLAYDLVEKRWHQWTDVNGNYMPIVASTYDSSMRHILQHESNGKLYYADRAYTNDDGSDIIVDMYLPPFDGGTEIGKHMPLFSVIADQQPGGIMQVRHNDNDYAADKWSNFRYINMANKKKSLDDNGSFIKRDYNLRYVCDTRMRVSAIEVKLDLCTL